MWAHRVVVLDVLTRHPPQMPFVDGDDVIEALAPVTRFTLRRLARVRPQARGREVEECRELRLDDAGSHGVPKADVNLERDPPPRRSAQQG